MPTNIDPFDISSLEKSVNDSAASVSTIWASYLLFGLYLALTAGSVTPRQLLLEDPVKLPVLNVDLPMVGFFAIAPALFVVLHCYVLMQAIMLAQTAALYNQAVDSGVSIASDRKRLRLRLANNLFAQIFAGALREGEGLIGWLVRQVAWITLVAAPFIVLTTFAYRFLPFHSGPVTWTHRILALLDALSIMLFWSGLVRAVKQVGALDRWKMSFIGFVLLGVLISLFGILLSFPGERQAGWARYLTDEARSRPGLEECRTTSWLESVVERNFDRIALPNEAIIDAAKLSEIEKRLSTGQPYLGERTRTFRDRDFRCASFEGADLRRADLKGADLSGSNFVAAKIQGVTFDYATLTASDLTSSLADSTSFGLAHLPFATLIRAQLRGANFQGASLERADLGLAQLQNADFSASLLRDANFLRADIRGGKFRDAQLEGTFFTEALLQGADFSGAWLQGTDFAQADVRNGNLSGANAQGTTFLLANLQGAEFNRTQLQGVSFIRTYLQGANLELSQLQGAVFYQTQLEGTNFGYAAMELAYMLQPFLWQSNVRDCGDAIIMDPQLEPIIGVKFPPLGHGERIGFTSESMDTFISDSRRTMPDDLRDSFEAQLRQRLSLNPVNHGAELWQACSAKSDIDAFRKKFARYLVGLVCNNQMELRSYVGRGVLRTWKSGFLSVDRMAGYISSGFANSDEKSCPISDQ